MCKFCVGIISNVPLGKVTLVFQMMKSVPWGSPSISGLQVGAMEQLNSRIFWQIAFGLLRRFGNSHTGQHIPSRHMLGTYLLVLSLLTTCLGIVYIKSCCVVELRRNKRNQIWLKMVMCRDRQHFPLKDMFFPSTEDNATMFPSCRLVCSMGVVLTLM